MFDVTMTFGVFVLAAGALFAVASTRVAILITVLGGWLLLPVGLYPPNPVETAFPYWIIGVAFPSDMLINKGWIVPSTALFWALVTARGDLRHWRPHPLDLPMLLWCGLPILASFAWPAPDPHPAIASAYLFASWGALWLLGRIWFATPEGQVDLAKGLALLAVAATPIAWVEGQSLASFHEMLFDPHPYRREGAARAVGYRSIGMFEHGNQYAIWVSLGALAAIWIALSREVSAGARPLWIAVALVAITVGVVHQSRGAILLLLLGLVLLTIWRFRLAPLLLLGGVAALAVLFGLHYSGALLNWLISSGLVPSDVLQRGSAGAGQVRRFFNEFGLGSFVYRIWQDYQTRELVLSAPWIGHGQWDWWRDAGTRPWGAWVLVSGQYGVIGAGLALFSVLGGALTGLWRRRRTNPWRISGAPVFVGIVVLMGLVDATQNSFLFFPALLGAGAIAVRHGVQPVPAAA